MPPVIPEATAIGNGAGRFRAEPRSGRGMAGRHRPAGNRGISYQAWAPAPVTQRRTGRVGGTAASGWRRHAVSLLIAGLLPVAATSAADCARLCEADFMLRAEVEEVRELLQQGAVATATDAHGRTPLHAAAAFSPHPETVLLLVLRGAKLAMRDRAGHEPLHAAASFNADPRMVESLLKLGAGLEARDNQGWTPLLSAAARNANPEVVAQLLTAGADLLVQAGQGASVLHVAAERNRSAAVTALLVERGANVAARDRNGHTPLHAAARGNNAAAAAQLAAMHLAVDVRTPDMLTPLHVAADHGHDEVMRRLLALGAAPGARDRLGFTPLHYGVRQRHWAIATRLVEAGADVDARDWILGSTPLHVAAALGVEPRMVRTLLDLGADPRLSDRTDRNALDHLDANPVLHRGAVRRWLQ